MKASKPVGLLKYPATFSTHLCSVKYKLSKDHLVTFSTCVCNVKCESACPNNSMARSRSSGDGCVPENGHEKKRRVCSTS